MNNFAYFNPVHIEFGRGTIARLSDLIAPDRRVMLIYGGGSIHRNGVYDQVRNALEKHDVAEFGGIEPNPQYDTCMRAVQAVKDHRSDFLLAVGGGSVIDATKFIAAAARYTGDDPWDILARGAAVESAVELGAVLTLPAAGSEMNRGAVISRESTQQKLGFFSSKVFPRFSVLDPETTFSLPRRQVLNGIVDTVVHVLEQHVTKDLGAPLQDRQAEAILLTMIERSPAILAEPPDYDARADFMWCAASALNGLIGCGVAHDWATHVIGHELTVLHGLDHGQTLAVVLPAVWKHQLESKTPRLAQYARRVWGMDGQSASPLELAQAAIDRTEDYFKEIGIATRLGDYGLTAEDCQPAVERLVERGVKLGENQNIGGPEVAEILALAE